MKLRVLMMGLLGCAATLAWGADAPELKDAKEKFSYAVGMSLGGGWKRQYIEVDLDVMLKGIKDAQAGKTLLTDAEARETLVAYQKEHNAWLAEKHKKDGEAFLAQNKNKEGVVTLPSGLQYKVLAEGKGESPKTNDLVTVNFRGTFIDGTEFDSSYKNNQPATLALSRGRVIDGWCEALALMKPGAKWQLFIPPNLGYGERGRGPVPPNATLIFEVELLSFQSPQSPKPAPSQPVTSDIIRVPSKEEMDKGAQPQIIKPEDVEKIKAQEKEKADKEKPKPASTSDSRLKDGFLEKEYPVSVGEAENVQSRLFKGCLPGDIRIIPKGSIRQYFFGDEQGVVQLPQKGFGVEVRTVEKGDNLVTVAIKVGDGNFEASQKLHNSFQKILDATPKTEVK